MSTALVSRYLASIIKRGTLAVSFADSTSRTFGSPAAGFPDVAIRFADRGVPRDIILDPRLGAAEAFMDERLVIERGGIMELVELMRANPSYIFFKLLTGPGPLGAMGLPVSPRATVAADPNFIPLGAPVFLAADRPEAWGIWVAQDTGGAIKGANRVDTFWGAGEQARRIAGGMSASGQALVLVPRGAAARALAQR